MFCCSLSAGSSLLSFFDFEFLAFPSSVLVESVFFSSSTSNKLDHIGRKLTNLVQETGQGNIVGWVSLGKTLHLCFFSRDVWLLADRIDLQVQWMIIGFIQDMNESAMLAAFPCERTVPFPSKAGTFPGDGAETFMATFGTVHQSCVAPSGSGRFRPLGREAMAA